MIQPFEIETAGDPAAPMLFFLHGWPDDASLWRKQFVALQEQYYCVATTLPNFGKEAIKPGGYDFPQLIEGLAATLRQQQHNNEPVCLVSHDWGAYLGYMLQARHTELINRMVALDIGGHAKPSGFRDMLMIVAYQWALILCWLVGGSLPPLGNWLSRRVGRIIRVPSRQNSGLKSRCNYPYFYFWRGMLVPRWKRSLLGYYKPTCPVLYLYGKRKPVMFHSERWLKIVNDSGGRSEGIEGAGHWFMETHSDIVNQAISDWCRPGAVRS